jgi:hypothetical protein
MNAFIWTGLILFIEKEYSIFQIVVIESNVLPHTLAEMIASQDRKTETLRNPMKCWCILGNKNIQGKLFFCGV